MMASKLIMHSGDESSSRDLITNLTFAIVHDTHTPLSYAIDLAVGGPPTCALGRIYIATLYNADPARTQCWLLNPFTGGVKINNLGILHCTTISAIAYRQPPTIKFLSPVHILHFSRATMIQQHYTQ